MMLGRFQSWAWVRLKDGRVFWGWFEETRVATSWFLGYSEEKPGHGEERETYFATGEVQEMHPCDEEACTELTARFGFAPVDYDLFVADRTRGDVVVEIRQNTWGGWSSYPVSRAARSLFGCAHGEDAENRTGGLVPLRSEVDTRGPLSSVCERLRGISRALSTRPERAIGGCLKCPTGNFPSEAAARAAVADNGWKVCETEAPQPEEAR